MIHDGTLVGTWYLPFEGGWGHVNVSLVFGICTKRKDLSKNEIENSENAALVD